MEVAMAYRRRGKKDALAGEDIDVDGFEKTYHDKSKESMQIICQALASTSSSRRLRRRTASTSRSR